MSNKIQQVEGLLVIVSAPSGCGKTTVVDRLLKRHPDWLRSVSATTRSPRTGEKSGSDYFFLSPGEFEEMRKKGDFLEYASVHGRSYGTPKPYVTEQYQKGKTVVLAIDVQGMRKAKDAVEGSLSLMSIFILPPSLKVLKQRLEGRKTETPTEIEKRMKVAEEEIKQAKLFDHTVINQNVETTVLEIDELINKFRKQRR